MTQRIWERCIYHRGEAADNFVREYFSGDTQKVCLVGGAGFDPRSYYLTDLCTGVCRNPISGFFLREERPDPDPELLKLAEANDAKIREYLPSVAIEKIEVFGSDGAPVGGRRAAKKLSESISLDGVTDLLIDCSALSVGLMFPIVRFCLDKVRSVSDAVNLHLFVLDAPHIDSAIRSTSCGKAAPLHTFDGALELDEAKEAVRLWMPQLGTNRRQALQLIEEHVRPNAVSPVIPFPATDPREGDRLIEEYGDRFDAIVGEMTGAWDVDARDIVYAHEKNPLDLYRTVLNIADARERVFKETGGSKLVLSPLGSKAVAIGLLMAALERDFAVFSVESIGYSVDHAPGGTGMGLGTAELVHVWLHGSAYSCDLNKQEATP